MWQILILLIMSDILTALTLLETGQEDYADDIMPNIILLKRDKRARRSFVIKCCGKSSCQGPRRPANKRRFRSTTKNPFATFQYQRPINTLGRAVAVYSEDGFSLQCRGCPENWNELLAFEPAPPGSIPLICPDCPSDWQDLIDIDSYSGKVTTNKPKKSSEPKDETDEDYEPDYNGDDGEYEENTSSKNDITFKFGSTTTTSITTTLISNNTSNSTTLAAANVTKDTKTAALVRLADIPISPPRVVRAVNEALPQVTTGLEGLLGGTPAPIKPTTTTTISPIKLGFVDDY